MGVAEVKVPPVRVTLTITTLAISFFLLTILN